MPEQLYSINGTINYLDGTERDFNLERQVNLGALENVIADYVLDPLATSFVFVVGKV